MIGVKNLSGHKLVAKYDGREFVFEADEKVTTPLGEDAARHIFGYGEREKTKALLRLGWLANGAHLESGLERLGKFQFLSVDDIKFKEPETTLELPRKVAHNAPGPETPLSEDERAIADTLKSPEGSTKKFARSKT